MAKIPSVVADRLRLPWDEFNRAPVSGVTNIAAKAPGAAEQNIAQPTDSSAQKGRVETDERRVPMHGGPHPDHRLREAQSRPARRALAWTN